MAMGQVLRLELPTHTVDRLGDSETQCARRASWWRSCLDICLKSRLRELLYWLLDGSLGVGQAPTEVTLIKNRQIVWHDWMYLVCIMLPIYSAGSPCMVCFRLYW